MLPAIIIFVALAALAGSIVMTHKDHNVVEKVASDVIQKETGVDVDAILPADK